MMGWVWRVGIYVLLVSIVWFGHMNCCLWLIIPQPIDRHVILLYEHRDVKLGGVDHKVQFLHFIDVVKLMLYGRSHEGGEPPAGEPGPHGGMDGVKI